MRRSPTLLVFVAVSAAIACGDPYAHTNPYDPAYSVNIAITGPDTLFSLGAIAQFTATATPAFSDTSISWILDSAAFLTTENGTSVANGGDYLTIGGSGEYVAKWLPLEPASISINIDAVIGGIDTTFQIAIPGTDPVIDQTVREKIYRHSGTRTIVLTQRVTRIQLRCPDTHACDTLSVGDTAAVWVNGFDALGRQIVALTSSIANPATGPPVVTYAARDTTIARSSPVGIRATNVVALKSGTTWVTATRGTLSDSLQIVVR